MIITISLFLFIELIFVTYGDLKYRTIKNSWSILNLVLSLFFFIFLPDLYLFKLESFQFSIVFILVGFLLYLLRIMGGGDSKFLATFFLLIPLKLQEEFFYYLLITTILLGSGFLLSNLYKYREVILQSLKVGDVQGVKNCFGSKFAYAPVILLSWTYLSFLLLIK